MLTIPGSWQATLILVLVLLILVGLALMMRGRPRRIIKPFAFRCGQPDCRGEEQMRSHDSIVEKRWRQRVAANEARRRARRRATEWESSPLFRQLRIDQRTRLGI